MYKELKYEISHTANINLQQTSYVKSPNLVNIVMKGNSKN